jgi:Uma2 family endonuclease
LSIMSVLAPPAAPFLTVADLVEHLDGIPGSRIRLQPAPGTATEADLLTFSARDGRLYELVDGVLVEKTMGHFEGRLAHVLGYFIEDFLTGHDLGIVYGADSTLRIARGLVRLPDLSFVSWAKLPGRLLPAEAVADLVPDLAVEVLSESNTDTEMRRKRREYFGAGTRLVWEIDPDTGTAEVFTAPEQGTTVPEDGELNGGDVLPGFTLSLRRLFERAGRRAER